MKQIEHVVEILEEYGRQTQLKKAATLHNNLAKFYLKRKRFDKAGVCFDAEEKLTQKIESSE